MLSNIGRGVCILFHSCKVGDCDVATPISQVFGRDFICSRSRSRFLALSRSRLGVPPCHRRGRGYVVFEPFTLICFWRRGSQQIIDYGQGKNTKYRIVRAMTEPSWSKNKGIHYRQPGSHERAVDNFTDLRYP